MSYSHQQARTLHHHDLRVSFQSVLLDSTQGHRLINKFVDYDDSVGTYDKYIFKNFKEWDWFESELGNYEKNVLFSDMESKNKMFSCDFDIIESVKKNKYSKTVKDSLLNYLDQEIEILKEREDLVLNTQFQDIPVTN